METLYRDVHLYHRANELLNLRRFSNADQNVDSIQLREWELGDLPEDQYILRMLVSSPSTGLCIPPELDWLIPAMQLCIDNQINLNKCHPFIYVTVRSGIVRSVSDDEWHVDGFSMRVAHEPEQNYIWTNCWPTEHLAQQFDIPEDFDPLKHNIHQFFQDRADESNIKQLECNRLHLIDPYIVHRRPKVPVGTYRTFFRISFVPIEIEDDTNTPNPLLPVRKYGRTDIRKTLTRYK